MVSKAFSVASVCPGVSEAVGTFSDLSVSNRLFPLKRRARIVQPFLGATSQLIDSSKWYKDVGGLGVDAIEINRRHSKLHFNVYFLDKVKRYLQGTNVSVHSATTGIFQELESFTQAELATLQAEVDVARFLGAHEVVFHLNGGALMHEDHKERLAQIINYGKERGVDLIYESDTVLQADQTCEVLEAFSDVGYALDLGHLNNGYRRNLLGCDIDEFISRVRERIVYIHSNNNCGTVDEHKGVNDVSLDWRRVLGMLDMRRIKKIIIEVCSIEYLKDTQDELRDYLAGRVCKAV
jgi:sugar phosphate isomerase/epimerase